MKKTAIGIAILIICLAFIVFTKMTTQSEEKNKMRLKAKSDLASGESQIKLTFVIDQSFGNGIVVRGDAEGMQRIIDSLKPLQEYYDVYALFGPQVADKNNLETMLDLCAGNDLPFMFDVISSDGMALAACPQTAAVDEVHGVEISLKKLAEYKKRYGRHLAGIRFMEVFGQDFVARVMTKNPEWIHEGYNGMPDPNVRFFDTDIVRPFFQFASNNDMFVQWSDHHWSRFKDWDLPQKEIEKALAELIAEFPGLVTVTYANNEGNKESIKRFSNWQEAVEPFVKTGAQNFGLSNQAWLHFVPNEKLETECPIEDIIAWQRLALKLGCRYIQYEPSWYFFELPRGTLMKETYDYTKDKKWENRGTPRTEFKELIKELLKMATDGKTETNQELRPIHVENGVFLYPDGSEVALFGTNYLPMGWHQYNNMKALNVDFRQAIKQDVSDMKACGIQVVRVHYFESESCDADGNLVENDNLRVFDILIDELNRQGIYMYLTPLGWWQSPCELPDAYSRKITKMRMMYGEHALSSSENFINQFLTHTNPYTGRQLKDEPCFGVIEIINEPWYWPYESIADPDFDPGFLGWQAEPEVVKKDFELWKQMWQSYCEEKQLKLSKENYIEFQYEKMSTFLRRMIGAIRNTGANQPIASALFEAYSNKKHSNEGILKAIGESEVDAVTDGWYPGGFTQLNEYINQMPTEAQAYQLPQEVQHKAKMVYEFDICNTYNNVGMYPAMARRWRSMGAQIACQFQYDAAITAPYNTDWGNHYFNCEITPAKAVAFNVASKTFAAVPRDIQYPTPADNEIFYDTAVSFEHRQVLRVADNEVYYVHSLEDWIPLELPSSPKLIMGRGNSPFVEYSGSGFYKLEWISPTEIKLSITRNTTIHEKIDIDFFLKTSLDKPKVTLNNSSQQFQLKLNGWDEFKCVDQKGQEVKVAQRRFEIVPGNIYFLHKKTP